MLVVKGRVLPLSADPTVAPSESASFAGRVWVGDDGRVAAVTKGAKAGPPGFAGAPVVDVGTSLVLPGLVDLHNHLAYNTLPLWTQPGRTTPFAHHNSWPSASTYAADVTWPAYAFITASPEELLAFVETKAVVGGTTTIQGSPPKNHPLDGWLVRNVEDESFGVKGVDYVYASTLTAKSAQLADRANKMVAGSTFIYHCAEGQPGSVVQQEFVDAENAGCLQERFVAVHASAVPHGGFAPWTKPGAVAWSPFSNLWLYGVTTDVPSALAQGVRICLGSDWAPSGTKHVLGELKVARLVSDARGWGFTDEDIVRMATVNPGDILFRSWARQVGRLQPGAIADVLVLAAGRGVDPFRAVLAATEADVRLVVIAGQPVYGEPALMSTAGAKDTSTLDIRGKPRALALTRPDGSGSPWAWSDVLARLEQVRADPASAITAAQARLSGWSGRLDHPDAPLRLALDMPTGVAPVGGLPKDLGQVVVPPLQSLVHDADWLTSVHGRGFHGGLLDGLSGYYAGAG